MQRRLTHFKWFALLILYPLIAQSRLQDFSKNSNITSGKHAGCAYLHCEDDSVCEHRKFRCASPPCPTMLYCARSRRESLRGPPTCDVVYCSRGYVCIVKVRRCRWDKKCKQQIARCVSRREYHEGPASCAGFKCPQGSHCILRESFCVHPPCKLLKSCVKNKDVQIWFGKCRNLGCPSEFECFLRRPENKCSNPPCKHTPDCVKTAEGEIKNDHCRGWICPRMHKCFADIVGPCLKDDCNIERTCHEILVATGNGSSFSSVMSIDNKTRSLTSSNINFQHPSNSSEEKNTNEKRKIPDIWLNHLKSKTELDAIALWVKNAARQRDFTQFQDWLQSVKDILGPVGYTAWLEEILSSASPGEEFRKWLRASHVLGLPDADKKHESPIFPGQEEPQNDVSRTVTKDRYLHQDTSQPVHKGSDVLPPQLSDAKNVYGLSHYTFPGRKVAETDNFQLVNRNADSGYESNKNMFHEQKNPFAFNISEALKSLSVNNDESLWTELNENNEEISLAEKDRHRFQISSNDFENKTEVHSAQKFDNISPDLLEEFIKLVQLSSLGELQQTADYQSMKENGHDMSQEELQIKRLSPHYNWKLETEDNEFEDTGTNKSLVGMTPEHYSDGDYGAKRIFMNNLGPDNSNFFFNKLADTQIFNRQDELTDTDLVPKLKVSQNEDDDTIDPNVSLETNNENLLPYLQTLLEAINQGTDQSSNVELNSDESSVKKSIVSNESSSNIDEISNDFEFSNNKSKHIGNTEQLSKPTNISQNFESTFHWPPTREESSEDFVQNEIQLSTSTPEKLEQGKNSRTAGLIYDDEELMAQSFYDIPSYGASDTDDMVAEDYVYGISKNNSFENSDTKGIV